MKTCKLVMPITLYHMALLNFQRNNDQRNGIVPQLLLVSIQVSVITLEKMHNIKQYVCTKVSKLVR